MDTIVAFRTAEADEIGEIRRTGKEIALGRPLPKPAMLLRIAEARRLNCSIGVIAGMICEPRLDVRPVSAEPQERVTSRHV